MPSTIVLYCFWWGVHCCPMHCDLFKIYCAPPNLGITRTWICRLNFAQRPIFSGLRFFNEPEILDSGPESLKSLPEDLCSRFLRHEKIHRPQPDLNPRTLDLEASTLSRDHRGRHPVPKVQFTQLRSQDRITVAERVVLEGPSLNYFLEFRSLCYLYVPIFPSLLKSLHSRSLIILHLHIISHKLFSNDSRLSASVVSRKHARLEIQGSRVQIRLRSMNFSGRKNPEPKSSGRDFKLGVLSLRFLAL